MKLDREFVIVSLDSLKIFENPVCSSYSKDIFSLSETGILTPIPKASPKSVVLKASLPSSRKLREKMSEV